MRGGTMVVHRPHKPEDESSNLSPAPSSDPGMAQPGIERLLWEQDGGGSNPPARTK